MMPQRLGIPKSIAVVFFDKVAYLAFALSWKKNC
jgi:hypothetical protein